MSLQLPSITIAFQNIANTTISLGVRGTVAVILKDAAANGACIMTSASDIPSALTTANKTQLGLIFTGGLNPDGSAAKPKKVIAFVEASTATDYSAAETYFESITWDYLVIPGIATADVSAMATWVKGLRDSKNRRVKAILPNSASDHEGIIDFATDSIVVGETTYGVADYCSRIAGICAGIPLTVSATYQVLGEITSIPAQTVSDINTAIAAGKLVLFRDGDFVRIARGVNSLVTTTPVKGVDFQKIQLVDIMDQIYSDIKNTANSTYIGKVPNDYDHKCILISAINTYLDALAKASILDRTAVNSVGIDIAAQTAYLKTQGVDTSQLTTQQIKEYNTGSYVFLAGSITLVGAMEDIALNFALGA